MSALDLRLAAQIDYARAALRSAAPGSAADLAAALHHAEDCLADLERAARLLDLERTSAESALRALDCAVTLRRIAAATDSPAEIQRRAAANKRRIAALQKGGLL